MFTIDQDITVPKLREKNLVKVFFSINNHQVATPEMMLEDARSYVMFCNEAGGKVSAYIGLYLLDSGRRLFYAHSSNPFLLGEMGSVEDEALCFVEGLGALVDQIDIANLSSEEKNRWVEEQDIFSLQARPQKSPEAESPEPAEAEAAQAEPRAMQPPPAVPEAATPPPVQPELQAEPAAQTQPSLQPAPQVQPASEPTSQAQPAPQIQPTPQPAPPVQPAPQPSPQAEASPQAAPPVEEAPTARAEESIPRPSVPQPPAEPDEEYEEHAAPSSADEDVSETRVAPKTRSASKGASRREATVPVQEGTRPKPAARSSGPKAAPQAASSMGKQDIMQKAINAGVVRPPKPSLKKGAEDDTGVVRRDREALARLLTSF